MTKRKSKKDAPGSKRVPIYLNARQVSVLEDIVEKGEWKSTYAYLKSVITRHMKLMQRVYKGELIPDPLGIALKADFGITHIQSPDHIQPPPEQIPTSSDQPPPEQISDPLTAPVSEEAIAHGEWMTEYLKAQKNTLLERESLLEHMSEVRSALKKDLSPVGTFTTPSNNEEMAEESPMDMKDELKSLFTKKKKEAPSIE